MAKATKKVAAKKAAKKVTPITRASFPDKGWGLSKKQHDQVAAFGIKHELRNLSQVIRYALNKAVGISLDVE